jgi:hypothetical protein
LSGAGVSARHGQELLGQAIVGSHFHELFQLSLGRILVAHRNVVVREQESRVRNLGMRARILLELASLLRTSATFGTPVRTTANESIDSEVIEFRDAFEARSALDEIVREGARQMLQAAIEAEVDGFLVQHADRRDVTASVWSSAMGTSPPENCSREQVLWK